MAAFRRVPACPMIFPVGQTQNYEWPAHAGHPFLLVVWELEKFPRDPITLSDDDWGVYSSLQKGI